MADEIPLETIAKQRRDAYVSWAHEDGGHTAWDDVIDFLSDSQFATDRKLADALKFGTYTDMRPTRDENELKEFPSGAVPTGAFRLTKDLYSEKGAHRHLRIPS